MLCPICHHDAQREGNPYRPFCSERCKLIDLDNWLSGRYRIPTPAERSEGETGLAEEPSTDEAEGDARDPEFQQAG